MTDHWLTALDSIGLPSDKKAPVRDLIVREAVSAHAAGSSKWKRAASRAAADKMQLEEILLRSEAREATLMRELRDLVHTWESMGPKRQSTRDLLDALKAIVGGPALEGDEEDER